jgi:hypothetical protein
MMMTKTYALRVGSGLAIVAGITAPAAVSSQTANGTATYVISAETDAGMASSVLAGGPTLRLGLQLGSTRSAAEPQAEHFVPEGLGLGASVPLVRPVADKTEPTQGYIGTIPQPKGKMRIMWGCGETLKPGNMREIDFANLGSVTPVGLQARLAQDLAARGLPGYAEWPNAKNAKNLPGRGSLVGAHRVSANYAPGFEFNMASGHDFLKPLAVNQAQTGAGATTVDWQGLDRATGYFLSVIGTQPDGTVIMWSSNDVALQDSVMGQYLPPAEVARLVAAKAILPADARSCTVPKEVISAVETPMLMMTAYADNTHFAQPKPEKAPANWKPEWAVEVRYKSGTMLMLGEAGQAVAAMQAGMLPDEDEEFEAAEAAEEASAPRKRRGLLGSIIEQAITN